MSHNTFKFTIGWDPYHHSHNDYHTKGNGEWTTAASNVQEALGIIFATMPFPAEAAGRKVFVEGISRIGEDSREIIQVWSSEPDVVMRTRKALKPSKHDRGGFHDGNGHDFGLALEVKVTEIETYLKPIRALLGAGTSDETGLATNAQLSPMGASLVSFAEMRHEMTAASQVQRFEIAKREWELEKLQDEMREKMKLMQAQMYVLDAYLHGTRYRTQMTTGAKGQGKYAVFQNRQYLSEEIALLANFRDFDFANMEALEKWLIKSGRIWKFLPYERCILCTRIRKENKEYGGRPIDNLWKNELNMQNMIWVRDGQNVFHVDIEFKFTNAVFPDRNQFERAFQDVLNYVWDRSFKEKPPTDWRGDVLKPGEYDEIGKMRRKPFDEEEPYYTRRVQRNRYNSVQEWLDSPDYTEVFDKQLRDEVHEYLRKVNRRQMVFAVILQGIIDNTDMLDIPKGTDLFDWNMVDKYFNLVYDYTHALPWDGIANKVAPYIDGKARIGEWLIVKLNEYVEPPKDAEGHRTRSTGVHHKEKYPMLLKVQAIEDGKPVVQYRPVRTRRNRDESWQDFYYRKGPSPRVKSPIKLVLKQSKFMRLPMAPSLAEKVLDDREWKKENQWAVPFMVNYKAIVKMAQKPVNGAIVEVEHFE